MVGIGVDIGSTAAKAAKAAVMKTDGTIAWTCVMPAGCSSVDAAIRVQALMWGLRHTPAFPGAAMRILGEND